MRSHQLRPLRYYADLSYHDNISEQSLVIDMYICTMSQLVTWCDRTLIGTGTLTVGCFKNKVIDFHNSFSNEEVSYRLKLIILSLQSHL